MWSHVWTLCAYRPKPYAGFVALFVTEDTTFEIPEPGRGWEKYTSHLQEYPLRGNHGNCVTTHKAVLIEQLRQCLAAIPPATPPAHLVRPSSER